MNILSIKIGSGTMHIHKDEYDAIQSFYRKQETRLFRYMALPLEERVSIDKKKETRRRNKDVRKWAWVVQGNTKKLCFVDKQTMRAYKAEKYTPTWMEIKNPTFKRWATGHDL
jgi:hypothetical protein